MAVKEMGITKVDGTSQAVPLMIGHLKGDVYFKEDIVLCQGIKQEGTDFATTLDSRLSKISKK